MSSRCGRRRGAGSQMSWISLDDKSPHHPKFIVAGPRSWELFVAGLCYCSQHLTDGLIPVGAIGSLLPTMEQKLAKEIAGRLTTNRVKPAGEPSWTLEGNFYRVHDYEQHQQSSDNVKAKQEAGRQRAARSHLNRRSSPDLRAKKIEDTAENGGSGDGAFAESSPDLQVIPIPEPVPKEHPKAGALPSTPPPAKYSSPPKLAEEDDFEAIEARILAVCPPEMLAAGEAPNHNAIYRAVAHQRSLRSDGTPVDPTRPSRTVTEFCDGIEAWKASGRWGSKAGAYSHAPHLTTYLDNKRHLVPLPTPKASATLAAGTTPEHLERAQAFDRETRS